MRIILTAIVAAIVLAVAAMYVLEGIPVRADAAFSVPGSVRIPIHGVTHNLVGKDWSEPSEH